jgi:hypothetical protein
VRTGTLTKGALKLTLALACLLAALAALRGVVPPSLARTVVWTRWTVVPAAERGKWCACTTAYALTGGGDHLWPAAELHRRVVVVGHARGHTARPLAARGRRHGGRGVRGERLVSVPQRAGKERPSMTEQNQAQNLVARLRDALHKLDFALEHTREDVTEVASQAERLREDVAALGDLRQREDTSVGIEMLVDAATAFREAFRELESGLLDAQADVDTLEAAIEDDADGPQA